MPTTDHLAITAHHLAKHYRLGQAPLKRDFREVLSSVASAPWRLLRQRPKSDTTIWALRDISFDIPTGQVVGLVGRNGAGKSTLLKLLARIAEPSHGFADITGRVGSLLEVGTGFHPELTGRENIFLNGAILGMKRSEITRKFDQIVAFSEIERFIDTPVKRYSSGMYMRLAFAVAAHLEPEILVVDEVLAVGDIAFQRKCLGQMDLVAKQGRTVLFVSHNMGALTRLCSRALWLDDGLIREDGPAGQVVSHYQSQYLQVCPEWTRPASTPISHDAPFIFHRIALRTNATHPDHNPCLFAGDAPITIDIDYQVRHALAGCQIGLRLYNSEGVVVFSSSDADHAHVSALPKDVGTYRATLVLPGCFLPPGTYNLHLGAHLPFRQAYDTVPQAVVFEVAPSGTLTSLDGRLGVVAPLLPWHTVRHSV